MLNTIPTYDQLIYPLLQILANQTEPLKTKVVFQNVMNQIDLAPELRMEPLPNNTQPKIHNRIGWAHDRLKRMGWSHCPRRGYWQITEEGRACLQNFPKDFSDSTSRKMGYGIDGAKLTSLMIAYKLGVSVVRTVEIPRVDSDYFEDG